MVNFVVVIDSSASMNRKTSIGLSLLDIAKSAVENLIKLRNKDQNNKNKDKYLLFTTEENPLYIKVGWKESMDTFMSRLRELKAIGPNNICNCLSEVFDYLNMQRFQSGVDNFGMGRNINFIEPVVIIILSDEGEVYEESNFNELSLKLHLPGSELYKEPYRWDQIIYSIEFKMMEHENDGKRMEKKNSEMVFINDLCRATGGDTLNVNNSQTLMFALEFIMHSLKKSNCVKVDFSLSSFSSDIIPSGYNELSYLSPIFHNKNSSLLNWPLPESFWCDQTLISIPQRAAHPVLIISKQSIEIPKLSNLILKDEYEIINPSLFKFIQEEKLTSSTCFLVYMSNSGRVTGIGDSFAYMTYNSRMDGLILINLPYNYQLLSNLLDEFFNTFKCKPSIKWKQMFDSYLLNIPPYYLSSIRNLFRKSNTSHNILIESIDQIINGSLRFPFVSILKRIKTQARSSFEQISTLALNDERFLPVEISSSVPSHMLELDTNYRQVLFRNKLPLSKYENDASLFCENMDKFIENNSRNLNSCSFNSTNVKLVENHCQHILDDFLQSQKLMNYLVEHQKILSLPNPNKHSLPINQMGDYQEWIRSGSLPSPLREFDTSQRRQHLFGNPFKIIKDEFYAVDETDIDQTGNVNIISNPQPQKRIKPLNNPKHKNLSKNKKIKTLPESVISKSSLDSSTTSKSNSNSSIVIDSSMIFYRIDSIKFLTEWRKIIRSPNLPSTQTLIDMISSYGFNEIALKTLYEIVKLESSSFNRQQFVTNFFKKYIIL